MTIIDLFEIVGLRIIIKHLQDKRTAARIGNGPHIAYMHWQAASITELREYLELNSYYHLYILRTLRLEEFTLVVYPQSLDPTSH